MFESSAADLGVTLGDAATFRRRGEALERFARWRATHASRLSPATAIAGVAAIYEMLPASSRARAVDPSGVQRMHRCLGRLSSVAM